MRQLRKIGVGDSAWFTAAADIVCSRFVKFVTSLRANNLCVLAGLGDQPCGVSYQGASYPSNYAAQRGKQLYVYTASRPWEEPYIEVDAIYPPGTLLKPGVLGIGTIALGNNDVFGAILLEGSSRPNQLVQCRVVAPQWLNQ